MDIFNDIRPYNDNEVADVIKALLENDEFFTAISGFQFPRFNKLAPRISKKVIRKALTKKLNGVDTVAKFQDIISGYVAKVVKKSSTGVTVSGLSDLSKDKSYLFISNHRDIALDPALISYLLHRENHGTIEIAIGDNLLKKPFISDLMRLNRSFLVKRSVQGREKLLASKILSQYMHTAVEGGNNVWIAQREGRAKNGIDVTDPTVIKMLYMGKRDEDPRPSLKDAINGLHIIPVSISYEYDPCDGDKAKELFEIETNGSFTKSEKSDITSIAKGIEGFKGEMHLSFGAEINAIDSNASSIASLIDEQIITNYKLHSSNYLAYEKLQKENNSIGSDLNLLGVNIEKINGAREGFEKRLQSLDRELQSYFLNMYAAPVISKFQFQKN